MQDNLQIVHNIIHVCFTKVSYSVILEICMHKGHCFTDSVFSSAGVH